MKRTHIVSICIIACMLCILGSVTMWLCLSNCFNNDMNKSDVIIDTSTYNAVSDNNSIKTPVRVWTFWEGPMNVAIDACLKRIAKLCTQSNGKFLHTHLDYNTVINYIPDIVKHVCYCPTNLTLTSDIIRLLLLNKYGGLWVDAGVIPVSSMDDIVNTDMLHTFQAYHNPGHITDDINFPVIENSVMYSPPGHPLVKGWLQTIDTIHRCCDKSERVQHTYEFRGNKNRKLIRPYHFVYYALIDYIYSIKGIRNIPNVILKSTIREKFFMDNEKVSDLVNLSWKDYSAKYSSEHRPLIKLISSDYKNLCKELAKKHHKIHPQSILA